MVISLWTTQLHYDLRYECGDTIHRIFKGLQILLFVYVAASSGGWDLQNLAPPPEPDLATFTATDVQSNISHGEL